ncbi:MAG TPA: ribose 5-phosphate isomerase B [Bryobacteraceae bacterium]|jgi:RpiB/LacA/LacB family sugar-phosphate isomerase
MKIALGADHAAFPLKNHLRDALRQDGHEVIDFGTDSADSTDYPDYAKPVAQSVASGAADRGILVCTTGMGMCIAANKVHGVRAALAMNADEVRLTRLHNNANVLTLGAKYTDDAAADELVRLFLETPFEGGRHQRRVDKIMAMETL